MNIRIEHFRLSGVAYGLLDDRKTGLAICPILLQVIRATFDKGGRKPFRVGKQPL